MFSHPALDWIRKEKKLNKDDKLLFKAVDLEKYPINDRESKAYKKLMSKCHKQISDGGCVILKDFLRPKFLDELRKQMDGVDDKQFKLGKM